LDEAARFAELGREASPADDWASQISWRSALTQVLARRGDLGEAERLARECVALTEGVDYLNQMGEAWADLGYVLQLSGRREEAADALRRALGLYEAKGNVVSGGHTRNTLSELA